MAPAWARITAFATLLASGDLVGSAMPSNTCCRPSAPAIGSMAVVAATLSLQRRGSIHCAIVEGEAGRWALRWPQNARKRRRKPSCVFSRLAGDAAPRRKSSASRGSETVWATPDPACDERSRHSAAAARLSTRRSVTHMHAQNPDPFIYGGHASCSSGPGIVRVVRVTNHDAANLPLD